VTDWLKNKAKKSEREMKANSTKEEIKTVIKIAVDLNEVDDIAESPKEVENQQAVLPTIIQVKLFGKVVVINKA